MQVAPTYLSPESRDSLMAQTEARRVANAKARPLDLVLDERRIADMPVENDRRRFATMADKLAAAAARHAQARQYTGAPLTDFGLLA